jgi:hypothetical protein
VYEEAEAAWRVSLYPTERLAEDGTKLRQKFKSELMITSTATPASGIGFASVLMVLEGPCATLHHLLLPHYVL